MPSAVQHRRARQPGSIDAANIASRAAIYDAAILSDSPLGYWPLNELSGTSAADATGNGHTGTYTGTVFLGNPGALDYAVGLAGATQYVAVSTLTSFPTTGSYTWEALVNVPTPSNKVNIAGYGAASTRNSNAFDLSNNSGASGLYNWWFGDDYAQGGTISANTWTHVAVTYDGSKRRAYINGVQQGSDNTPGASPNFTLSGFRIGGFNSEWYVGRLERVALYGTALSAARLLAHKQLALG